KVALITGGARRLGAAITRRLHADGWRVVIHCQRSTTDADALAARASDAPLVLTFDDAQWLDDASVTLLHAVVRRLRRRPTLLVLAARRGELPDAAASRELLRALRRDRALDTVALGPLGVEALAQIVQTVGATTPDQPADLSRLVAEASGGNPLYALELARAGGEIGPSLRELVSDRLAPLREPALEVLRWGAIFGPTFDASWIEATVDLEADALLRALEELEAAGLVATSDPGGAELQLAHQLVHEVVYGGISAPRRRLMHARAAALLERLAARDVALVTEVARHALAAGDPSRAVRAHLDASAHLRRVFASHDAWRAAQRGLRAAEALPDPERTQATVELWRASLLARPAERGESARLVETIEALAERALDLGLDASARLAFRLASWLRWELDRPSEARLTMLRAEEISRDVSGGERVLALAEAARCLVLLERDLPQAEAWVREASALVRRGDPEPAALADASGRLAMHRGALDDAEPLLRRARDLARREHDASNEARAIEQLAHLACLRGLVIDALTHAEELVRRLERDPPPGGALPHARGLRALCQLRLGRPGAQEAVDAALDELEAVDAKRSLGLLSRATGEALSLRGDAERALPYAERATRCASALSSPSERALCHALAASVARALGDEDAARREAEAARAHAAAPLSAEARAALDALSTKAVG
ncbi:MAG: hypothetical protein KF901_26335, partial [Myxococcales bacterium]|nr:hypothetical protein [Myxococcales bacterium]